MNSDRAIIFANGSYSDPEFYKDLLKGDFYIVAADGGLNFLDSIGHRPDLIIGDLDSVDKEIVNKYKDIETIKHPVRKNLTDMELTLDYLSDRGFKEFKLVGAVGGRLDHSIDNIFLLETYRKKGIDIEILSPEETFQCLIGPATIKTNFKLNTTVSLISLSDEVGVEKIDGFSYPLENETLFRTAPGRATSNIVEEPEQSIAIKNGSLLVYNTTKI